MRVFRLFFISAILAPLSLTSCGSPPSALDKIRETLKGIPSYSIVLDDMKTEGTFFKQYYHKYKIITEKRKIGTGWAPVSKKNYDRNLSLLGMTIWVKQNGKESHASGPPGYAYVDNPRYGSWRSDSSGSSFWVFYGQYRLLGDLLGSGRLYRNHYSDYARHRARGAPYYGSRREYGTNGSLTRRQKPNFYNRAMAKAKSSNASFSDRVKGRIGRARTGFAGRSGRGGK